MTDFVLSAERRAELVELLDDEQRFAASYPTAADYLATAARLAGTGHDATDAAFDLRMLHYLTDSASVEGNPYWDIVGPAVSADSNAPTRVVSGGNPSGSPRLGYAQTVLHAAYSYAIPSPETLNWVVEACAGRPVLEIGAGRGYWAHQLARRGIDVAAFDSQPPDTTRNPSFPPTAHRTPTWHHVGDLAELATVGWDPERVLLLVWPPGWGNDMASAALTAYVAAGGNRLIYVGEPPGGKTADAAFFDALAAGWRPEADDPNFVSWWNLDDRAQCWTPA